MNTPRTKKPKRWEHVIPQNALSGSFSMGIFDEAILQAIGSIISMWSHAEEAMIHIFGELLGVIPGDGIALRQLYLNPAHSGLLRCRQTLC